MEPAQEKETAQGAAEPGEERIYQVELTFCCPDLWWDREAKDRNVNEGKVRLTGGG